MGLIRLFFLMGVVLCVHAADERPPELEPLPEPEMGEEELQPEVTIRREGKNKIEEYSIGGKVYMIKVIPPIGPPYYLLDTDGDGNMDVRRSDLEETLHIHQWKILEW